MIDHGSVRRAGVALALALGLALGAPAAAVQPEEMLDDPVLEQRARDISKGLRCVVCDNQSIDESEAQIAGDMRLLVRERLLEGDTDQEVRDLMVSYYGEFVLLKPSLSLRNLALWLTPGLALLLGVVWVRRRIARGRRADLDPSVAGAASGDGAALTEEERRRLAALMRE